MVLVEKVATAADCCCCCWDSNGSIVGFRLYAQPASGRSTAYFCFFRARKLLTRTPNNIGSLCTTRFLHYCDHAMFYFRIFLFHFAYTFFRVHFKRDRFSFSQKDSIFHAHSLKPNRIFLRTTIHNFSFLLFRKYPSRYFRHSQHSTLVSIFGFFTNYFSIGTKS